MGAIGADPRSGDIPSGLIEREMLLKLRFAFDHYINLRPARLYPGAVSPLSSPGEIDFVVVREGTEGPYAGNGGTLREGTQEQIATEVSLNTAHGVSRLIRYAFELAQSRRKKLTLIHKTNVLVHAGRLYTRLFEEIGREFPDVQTDYLHIDAATIFMTTDPSRFDVIVTDNLFGDILTDQAGAVTGGIGYAASGNINAAGKFPSMFEPCTVQPPILRGRSKANPDRPQSSQRPCCCGIWAMSRPPCALRKQSRPTCAPMVPAPAPPLRLVTTCWALSANHHQRAPAPQHRCAVPDSPGSNMRGAPISGTLKQGAASTHGLPTAGVVTNHSIPTRHPRSLTMRTAHLHSRAAHQVTNSHGRRTSMAIEFSHETNQNPASDARRAEILADPRVWRLLHRPHGQHRLER